MAVVGQEASPWPRPAAGPAGPAPTASLAAASTPDPVVDVQIRGNKSLPLSKILPHIRTRPGRPFDLELIDEDVRRLDRTHLFVNVRTYWQQVPGGRIVIFDVLERPLLQDVLFIGCSEIRKKALQKEADLKKGDPVDPFAIEEARRKLEEFYHKKGFPAARITLLEGDKPEDRRAIFLVNEGTKQKVWNTTFVGNTIADDGRLRTQIGTSRPFLWLFGGEFDRKKLDEDVDKLTAYYRGLGFFRARIGREVEFNEKENWVTITFVIDEGPRYKIRDVSVIGNTKYTSDELLADLKLKRDDYFNQAKMTADLSALQDKYGGIGYVFADVKADPRFLEEPAQLDLVYNIKEGDRYRVGKINVHIKGEYPHTQLTTVLNRLSFKPGDIVDIREIRRASGGSAPASCSRPIRPTATRRRSSSARRARKARIRKTTTRPRLPTSRNRSASRAGHGPGHGPRHGRRPGLERGCDHGDVTFRGQSPDSASCDRELDVTLDCGRYIGPKEEGRRRSEKAEGQRLASQHPVCSRSGLPPSALHPAADDLVQMAGELTDALAQASTAAAIARPADPDAVHVRRRPVHSGRSGQPPAMVRRSSGRPNQHPTSDLQDPRLPHRPRKPRRSSPRRPTGSRCGRRKTVPSGRSIRRKARTCLARSSARARRSATARPTAASSPGRCRSASRPKRP